MSTSLMIYLDNPSASYFPGQLVTGKLVMDLPSEKKTKGLKIVCSGKASVHWTESRTVTTGTGSNRRSRTETRHYSAAENYFYYKTYFIGHSGGPDITLAPGQTVYPFTFQLPPSIPSSFQGQHGYVQYSLQVTMKKSWAFDKTTTRPFTVNGILDLNTYAGANQPGQLVKSKHLGCCCCKSGPITLTARLEKSGFVPGEPLHLLAEINNLSNKELGCLYLRVTSHVTFYAEGHQKHQSERVAQSTLGGTVAPGESETVRSSALIIPALPPTNLAGCRIISLEYQLEIELELPSGHFNLKGGIPIIIGNIPFRDNFPQLTRPEQADLGPIPSAPPTQPIPGYPDLPPPTYEAACKLPGTGAEAGGGDLPTYGEALKAEGDENKGAIQFDPNFVPKYASYGFGWTQ